MRSKFDARAGFLEGKKGFEAVSCDLDATYIGEGFDFRVVDEDLVRLVARTELMLTHASLSSSLLVD